MEQQTQHAIEVLKRGGTVAFPTDTVYGLGADAFNREAARRIYEIKQRPAHLPLPLLLADKSELNLIASRVPEVAWLLANHFLPGGLTLVLQRAPRVPQWITAGGDTVAARVPNHPIPIALIRGLGSPLIGTSANLSGQPSPVNAQEVGEQLGDKIDFILDGGRCPGREESTILDLTGKVPRILREGAVPRLAIEMMCGIHK